MTTEIQQAETAIKAGDTKTGFEILRGYLAENPDSERAWWVLSGLVQRDQRATCLEQVLRINPDNQFARETLDKMLATPPQPETKPPRGIPPAPPSKPARKADPKSELHTWLYARGTRIYLTILGPENITRAATESQDFTQVRAAIQKGKIPEKLLTEMITIPLAAISRIKLISKGLQVSYLDGKDERILYLTLDDQTKAKTVLEVLKVKLGPDFIITTKPAKLGYGLLFSILLTFSAAALTAYFYWAAQEISSGRAAETGSVRAAWVITLANLLSPGGLFILGGLGILVALGISAVILLKPAGETELTRQ